MACDIANEIIRLYNVKFDNIHKTKKLEYVKMYENILTHKYNFIDSLKKELASIISDNNMLNYLYLSKGNSIAYFSNSDNSNPQNISNAIALVELITTETEAYSEIKLEYENELLQAEGEMTYSNIVSRPFVADKKATPVRWIIVALCGIAALLLSILTVVAIEDIKTKE